MHDLDIFHEHLGMSEEERAEIARTIWSQENVELSTIGIDIGSSTSHLLFAKVLLQRQSQGLSSRFVVVHRQVMWRSPIMLTPFLPDGTIDAARLGAFIADCYREAGFARDDVDSGAVILTGEAIKRHNARAIDELFAAEAGKFVCATAGHKLECTLAAHGAGAVRLSKERDACILHVDIGGGTTKLALIDRGKILGVSAFAVGGRLIAADEAGAFTRVDDSARLVADALGIATDPATLRAREPRAAIAARLAAIAADYILGSAPDALGRALLLTEPLARSATPAAITLSGGVSEYVFGYESRDYGDIACALAEALRGELSRRSGLTLIDPGQRIRATVIGASQFTVQVSGKTIHLPRPGVLPVHNVPVIHVPIREVPMSEVAVRDAPPPRAGEGQGEGASDPPPVDVPLPGSPPQAGEGKVQAATPDGGQAHGGVIDTAALTAAIRAGLARLDLNPDSQVAVAFTWPGDPDYPRLAAAAGVIMAALAPEGRRSQPLLLMIDGDVGKNSWPHPHRGTRPAG